jgi:hypothetical protein
MRKHKKFASLVETENQLVLPSNTEKNSLQFLFIIAREFSQFFKQIFGLCKGSSTDNVTRKKNLLVPMKSGDLSTLEPITFLRIERFFRWILRSDNQIFFFFLPFLGLVLLRCELSFVAFSEFLRINDRISKHSQNRQQKKNIWKFVEMILNFFAGFCYQFCFFAFLESLN